MYDLQVKSIYIYIYIYIFICLGHQLQMQPMVLLHRTCLGHLTVLRPAHKFSITRQIICVAIHPQPSVPHTNGDY